MDNLEIHFHKTPEDKKKSIENSILKRLQNPPEKIPGEYEKTEEEIKAIKVINDLIRKEIQSLGLSPKQPLPEDYVHLVDQKISKDLRMKGTGQFINENNNIRVNKEYLKGERLGVYVTILHEMIHYYSFMSFMAVRDEKVKTYRSGYSSQNPIDANLNHEHFRGFSEAIIEIMVAEIILKNRDFLIKEFNISEVELKNYFSDSGYEEAIHVLEIILEKMANSLNKDKTEIWNQFKKGLFTGEMMPLRDIEKVFGPGSLRVLAAMLSKGSTKNIKYIEKANMFEEFFKENDQNKRNILAKKILSERERLQYEKIIKNNKE